TIPPVGGRKTRRIPGGVPAPRRNRSASRVAATPPGSTRVQAIESGGGPGVPGPPPANSRHAILGASRHTRETASDLDICAVPVALFATRLTARRRLVRRGGGPATAASASFPHRGIPRSAPRSDRSLRSSSRADLRPPWPERIGDRAE